MSEAHRFCACESLALGDPLAGSAAHAERNLLLSWPRAKWRRNLRQASDMPDQVSAQLEAIAEAGRRVNLIHRRSQPSEDHCLYLMPENLRYDVAREELAVFLAALQRDEPLFHWEVASPTGPLLLCCTHGKKDKCCAKFGYSTYKALDALATERGLPFEVWESTTWAAAGSQPAPWCFPHYASTVASRQMMRPPCSQARWTTAPTCRATEAIRDSARYNSVPRSRRWSGWPHAE